MGGIKCPLYWDPTDRDAAGNDHRIAGAGVPAPMWDYCRSTQPEGSTDPLEVQQNDVTAPASAHRGCKCGFRGDVLEKYASNPAYRDKAGKFDWSRVPWSDRLGLEAMVVHYYRNKLASGAVDGLGTAMKTEGQICVRTPSSGSSHICPAMSEQSGSEKLGDGGWCGSHSWDFCTPADPDQESGAVAASSMMESKIGLNTGVSVKGQPEQLSINSVVASPQEADVGPFLGLIAPIAQQLRNYSPEHARKESRRQQAVAFL